MKNCGAYHDRVLLLRSMMNKRRRRRLRSGGDNRLILNTNNLIVLFSGWRRRRRLTAIRIGVISLASARISSGSGRSSGSTKPNTLARHAHLDALLEPTVLTSIAVEQQDDTLSVFHALVGHLLLNGAPEEAFAAFARCHSVVVAWRPVPAYLAQTYRARNHCWLLLLLLRVHWGRLHWVLVHA